MTMGVNLRRSGADRIVAPFQRPGTEVANAIIGPNVVDFFARSQQRENHFVLSKDCRHASSPLADRSVRKNWRQVQRLFDD